MCPSLPRPEDAPPRYGNLVRQTLHVQFPDGRLNERRSEVFVEIWYLHCCVLLCVVAAFFVFEFRSSVLAMLY